MPLTKAEVRHRATERRAGISEAERRAFGARLAALGPRLVVDFAPANRGLIVSLFSAIGSEPDMTPLGAALHGAGVVLALPVTGARTGPLTFRRWEPGETLIPGQLGILEPPATAPTLDPDVLFVPLAAFDRRGHRIGYGAGHYDRTLAALRAVKTVRAIGVAYALQEELFIANEPHDQPLDMIVTDRETVLCES